MRNIFKGGPLDGNVIMTSLLENGDGFTETLPLEEYDGDNPPEQGLDGIYARTWYWTGIGSEEDNETTVVLPVDEADEPQSSYADSDTPPPFDPGPTAKPKEAPKVKAGNTFIEDLRERRERIRCNRNDVAEIAGLSVGVIARIETKGGTEAENNSYLNALEHLERSRA